MKRTKIMIKENGKYIEHGFNDELNLKDSIFKHFDIDEKSTPKENYMGFAKRKSQRERERKEFKFRKYNDNVMYATWGNIKIKAEYYFI